MLTRIQNQLYIIGGMLATEPESWERYWNTADIKKYISELENTIDELSFGCHH
jgi:cob(I)alamin adenosyltransferase